MPAEKNLMRVRLKSEPPAFGCWLAFADPYVTEVMVTTEFDWFVIDAEHAPNDLARISEQLSVFDRSDKRAIVRLPSGEDWMIKRALDVGAQSLLIPMIDTREQAEVVIRACLYPPEGIRGSGAGAARASRFGSIRDYIDTANEEICILVQAESRAAIENLDEILTLDRLDGVFIGPSDLSNDMGFVGEPNAPEVLAVIHEALGKIRAAGKIAGVFAMDPSLVPGHVAAGATMLAAGVDVLMLKDAANSVAARLVTPKK